MADIVNLRMARKRKARDERQAAADANRTAHGMSKAERRLAADREARRTALLDGHRRDPAAKPKVD